MASNSTATQAGVFTWRGVRLDQRVIWATLTVGCALFAFVVVRAAWLHDDAYITFRTIDNALNGYGLRWNVAERVQTYTHPLWLLLFLPIIAVTGEVYYTSLLLSIALSVLTVIVLMRFVARSWLAAALVLAVALSSRAFVDYSTSGLENPLTHLLLAGVWALYFVGQRGSRNLLLLTLGASLVMLTRADAVWLVAPAVGWRAWQTGVRWRTAGALLLGLTPLLAWTFFSLLYYGFPFPNTAYAKLATGIPRDELLIQGLHYLWQSLTFDPLTLTVPAAAIVLSLLTRFRAGWPLAVGIVAQLLYVVSIGGDYMSGRFLTGALVTGLALLVALPLANNDRAALGAFALLLGIVSPHPPLRDSTAIYPFTYTSRLVSDERAAYYDASGLLSNHGNAPIIPNHSWVFSGSEARSRGPGLDVISNVGFYGYFAGPERQIVDELGLGDPLLARLPIDPTVPWKIGHYRRDLPPGYIETLLGDENRIADPDLATYYQRLALVTRGPLWSGDRLRTIIAFNLGRYDSLLDSYRNPAPRAVAAAKLGRPLAQGTPWNAPGTEQMTFGGLRIDFAERVQPAALELSVDNNDRYELTYLDGEAALSRLPFGPDSANEGLTIYRFDTPPAVRERGVTAVVVRPVQGDGRYSLGHLRIVD